MPQIRLYEDTPDSRDVANALAANVSVQRRRVSGVRCNRLLAGGLRLLTLGYLGWKTVFQSFLMLTTSRRFALAALSEALFSSA